MDNQLRRLIIKSLKDIKKHQLLKVNFDKPNKKTKIAKIEKVKFNNKPIKTTNSKNKTFNLPNYKHK